MRQIRRILRRTVRIALALAAAGVVVWSLAHVIHRDLVSGPEHDARVTLTVLQWGDAEETALLRNLMDRFETEHPDVRVELLSTPNYDVKLMTMISGGMSPDVFYLTDDNLSIWSNLGILYNLDPLIERDIAEHGDAFYEGFYPHLYTWYRYDGETEGRGPQYALPTWHTPFVMFVNTELLEKAGVAVPRGGWTWAEYEEALRRIHALGQDEAGRRIYGGTIATRHQYGLRTWMWNHGGQIFAGPRDADFADSVMDEDPDTRRALRRIQRLKFEERLVYSPAGGAVSVAQARQDRAWDVFLLGRSGMYGPANYVKMFDIVDREPDFNWTVVPVPSDPGRPSVSASVGIGWSIAATSRHPEEAFALVKFLTGPVGQRFLAERGVILPARQTVAESEAFLSGPWAEQREVFIRAAETSRIPAWPRIKAYLADFFNNVRAVTELDKVTPREAGQTLEKEWMARYHSPRNNIAGEPMRWDWALVGFGGLALAVGATVRLRRFGAGRLGRAQARSGLLFISPWLIGFAVLTVGPLLVSLLLSFTTWSALSPLGEARWIGLSNFEVMVTADHDFGAAVVVTLWYVLMFVPLGQILALAVALLLNSRIRGIGLFRTAYFVPSLITGVVLAVIGLALFSPEGGLLSEGLARVMPLLERPPDWFGQDAELLGVPGLVMLGLWGFGGPMVIYLAALQGVSRSLYEAAAIDGAGWWRRLLNVTLPTISPVILFNLIMALIASFQVFTLAKVMTGGGPDNATLVYVLYVFEEAFHMYNMGYASALAWVLFAIILVLSLLVLRWSRMWVHYERAQ